MACTAANEGPSPLGPQNIPLDTPSYYWDTGVWFEMPLGYQNPWVREDIADLVVDRDQFADIILTQSPWMGYDPETGCFDKDRITEERNFGRLFAFWYPSGEYVDHNVGNMWFATRCKSPPCDDGIRPNSDEVLIRFRMVWPPIPGVWESGRAKVFEVGERRKAEGRPLPSQADRLGRPLEKTDHNQNGPISGNKDYVIYSINHKEAAQVRCKGHFVETPFIRMCRGYYWDRVSGLFIKIYFPTELGQLGTEETYWQPMRIARDLVLSWRR